MSENYEVIRNILLQYAINRGKNYDKLWLDEHPLSMKNANKFMLASIVNYRDDANRVLANVRRFTEQVLGDPPRLWNYIIDSYSQDEWASKKNDFRIAWFQQAHDRIWRIGYDIVRFYNGDSREIWKEKNVSEVLSALKGSSSLPRGLNRRLPRLPRFKGLACGPKISNWIIGCLLDCRHIKGIGDVAADTHVCRVLGRIFDKDLNPYEAMQLARNIYPENPWELDIALWDIGIEYCRSDLLYCDNCPIGMEDKCQDYLRYKNDTDK